MPVLASGAAALVVAPGDDCSGSGSVPLLCESIRGLESLQLLSLIHCQLGSAAADALSELILRNRYVRQPPRQGHGL